MKFAINTIKILVYFVDLLSDYIIIDSTVNTKCFTHISLTVLNDLLICFNMEMLFKGKNIKSIHN